MHHAITEIFRIAKRRDHGKHPFLLRPFQMGLKAHHVIDAALGVVSPQLDHGIGLPACAWILEPHGLQRAVPQGVPATAGHDLHGHTALEHLSVLKAVDLGLLRGGQLPHKGVVFLRVHGAVDIVRGALVIPGGKPAALHVQRLEAHQRRGGIVKIQLCTLPEIIRDGLRHGI